MTNLELLARNVSAALREAANAFAIAENVDGLDRERDKLATVVADLDGIAVVLRERQKRD